MIKTSLIYRNSIIIFLGKIGGISKHGLIDYTNYFYRPYWFNPVIAFADFMLDLKNNVLGLFRKHQ